MDGYIGEKAGKNQRVTVTQENENSGKGVHGMAAVCTGPADTRHKARKSQVSFHTAIECWMLNDVMLPCATDIRIERECTRLG